MKGFLQLLLHTDTLQSHWKMKKGPSCHSLQDKPSITINIGADFQYFCDL